MMMPMLKNVFRHAVSMAYYAIGRRSTGLRGKVALLMYHRILSEKELEKYYVQPGMYVRDDVFEWQMAYLKKNFRILHLSELLDMWKNSSWDEHMKYCVITFDDGWLDNYVYAYPVLQKLNIPATIFLPTGLIGTNEWFWPDRLGIILKQAVLQGGPRVVDALCDKWPGFKNIKGEHAEDRINSIIEHVKFMPDDEMQSLIDKIDTALNQQLPEERILLNWQEIREMSAHNISFGSHSSSHCILTKLSPDRTREELNNSLKTLINKNINHVPILCYPNGNYTKEIAEIASSVGYEAAVTTKFGFETKISRRLFELKRIGIHNDISSTEPLLAFHLSGVNNMIRETLQ